MEKSIERGHKFLMLSSFAPLKPIINVDVLKNTVINRRLYWTEKFWKRVCWRDKSGTQLKGKKEYLHQDWRRENRKILWIMNYQCRNKTTWEYKKFYSLTIGKNALEHVDAERITISHVGNRNGPWWEDNKRIQETLQLFEKITAKWGKNGSLVLTNRESLLEHVDALAQVPLWSGCDDYITTEIGSPLVSEFDATGALSGYPLHARILMADNVSC